MITEFRIFHELYVFPLKINIHPPDKPTVADLYLIPQLYNARVFDIDVLAYSLLNQIDEKCQALDAFEKAMPESQPDYPGTVG